MKTFTISLGRGLDVDVLELVESKVGIYANSGAGKSHLMRLMAEQIGKRIPIHIIDWAGEWDTLRSKIDAVLVAKDGDLAPQVRTAAKLAKRLYEKRVSAILDVSSLPRVGRLQFVATYLEALLDVPPQHHMMIFIDEAHRMAPEIASKGGGKELLSAIQRSRSAVISAMDSGRKRAMGVVLATQRLSKISKDASAEANNVFVGRYAQDTDLKRVSETLGLERAQRDAPKTFKPGEFFAQGPALNKPGTTKFRSSNTVTKAPKFGSAPKTAAPSKSMQKFLVDLASIPEEVELEAKNFKEAKAELRKAQAEIKRLTKENKLARDGKMSNAQKGQFIHEAMEKVLPGMEAKADELLNREREKWLGRFRPLDKGLTAAIGTIEQLAAGFAEFKTALESVTEPSDFAKALVKGRSPKVEHTGTSTGRLDTTVPNFSNRPRNGAKAPVAHYVADKTGDVTSTKSRWGHENALPFSWTAVPGKVLTVVIQYYPEVLTLTRVAALAGVPRKSTFRNALSTLRTAELVASPEGPQSLKATEEAHRVHGSFLPALPQGDALIERWKSQLGGGVLRRIFDALLSLGGSGTKDAVLTEADVDDSSTSRNAFSKLRSLGLVDKGYPLKLSPHVLEAMG